MNATILLACSLAVHAPVRQAPSHSIVPNAIGINIHDQIPYFNLDDGQGDEMYDFGFRAARIEIAWPNHQGSPGGRFHMEKGDALIKRIADTGLRPLILLTYNNFQLLGGVSPHTDEQRADFNKFVDVCVEHFQKYNPIWEIGNEPTHKTFWQPYPNVHDFTKIVVSTSAEIKRLAPSATVCAASLFAVDEDFLETFIHEGGLANLDDISLHPYEHHAPESALKFYRHVQQLIKAQGLDHRVGIMCTEWGYSTDWKAVSDQRYAEYLPRMYLVDMMAGLDMTIVYEWSDRGTNPNHDPHPMAFGIRDIDNQPKPAYTALGNLLKALNGYQLDRFRADGPQHEYLMVFTKGSSTKVVGWVFHQDPEDLDPSQTDPKTFEEPPVSVEFQGRTLTLNSSPKIFDF